MQQVISLPLQRVSLGHEGLGLKTENAQQSFMASEQAADNV